MSGGKSNQGGVDRSRVAGGEDYEVEHVAERHGMSAEEARQQIKQHGNSRVHLDEAASKMR